MRTPSSSASWISQGWAGISARDSRQNSLTGAPESERAAGRVHGDVTATDDDYVLPAEIDGRPSLTRVKELHRVDDTREPLSGDARAYVPPVARREEHRIESGLSQRGHGADRGGWSRS